MSTQPASPSANQAPAAAASSTPTASASASASASADPPAATRRKAAASGTSASPSRLLLMVATRKGAWLFHSDAGRKTWRVDGPHFLGHTVHHLQLDPRDGRTLLAAARTGHLGPTVFRSTDLGGSWQEAQQPPAFAQPAQPASPAAGEAAREVPAHDLPARDFPAHNTPPDGVAAAAALPARSVDHTFWLTPGHASESGSWYAGTSPQGLFRSEDGGANWAPLPSVNDSPQFREWMGTVQDGTPDGPKLHSIIVDPRDPAHLLFAMSGGGVHESHDAGQSWTPLIEGLQVVEGFDAGSLTFHDPHCMRICPAQPDRLYQQNHVGIYRIDRGNGHGGNGNGNGKRDAWQRIGSRMPEHVGDIGLPLVVHPRDPDTAWVFPMDGTTVWPRTSPGGSAAAYGTRDGGASWQRLDKGLPQSQAWWTVKRQAMAVDAQPRPALYVGTTSGELWIGDDGGARWRNIARHLPEIYAVEAATPA